MTYEERCSGPPEGVERPEECEGSVEVGAEPMVLPGPPYGLVCEPCSAEAGLDPRELLDVVNEGLGGRGR